MNWRFPLVPILVGLAVLTAVVWGLVAYEMWDVLRCTAPIACQ